MNGTAGHHDGDGSPAILDPEAERRGWVGCSRLGPGSRVLVVEDDFMLAEDLRDRLERRGCQVMGPVDTVAQARALLLAGPAPDLAILDTHLEDETTDKLAEALRGSAVPFVFAADLEPWGLAQPLEASPSCPSRSISPRSIRVQRHDTAVRWSLGRMLVPSLLAASLSTVAGGAAAEAALPISNGSGMTLMEIYASECGADHWGEDLLHVHVVRDGEERVVTIPDKSARRSYDLRLVLENGREVLETADVCRGEGVRLAPR